MSIISGGIASIESLRQQLEDASVRVLRLETRCTTISSTVNNMEKLFNDVNKTISHMDEEIHNVNKWNIFYDGSLQDGYRGLGMLKESRDKKWKQYEEDAKCIRMKISCRQKEIEERKEEYERNLELVWKKIPAFVIKLEKEKAISSLSEQLKSMGIQQENSHLLTSNTQSKHQVLQNKKLELESSLNSRKKDLENWQKKLIERKANLQTTDQSKKALVCELKKLEGIEMSLTRSEKSNTVNEVKKSASMEEVKPTDFQSDIHDSGIVSMNEDNIKISNSAANVSVDESFMDHSMFEEKTSPKKLEAPKTPSKNVYGTSVGPMHSTPHSSTSKLTEFLQPKNSSHCSAPPNVTPIVTSLPLAKAPTRIFTPVNTIQKLDTKGGLGKLQGLRTSTPLKTTFPSNAKNESTPIKTDFIRTLPKTPISMINKSKSMILTTAATKSTASSVYPMNKGLLAPTPEKVNVLNVTPTKQMILPTITPSAPIKNSPLNNRVILNAASTAHAGNVLGRTEGVSGSQPESKKLKPSNSFTQVHKPLNPQTLDQGQKINTSSPLSDKTCNTKKPNESGDIEEATFSKMDRPEFDETPTKISNALPYEGIKKDSPVTMAVGGNPNDRKSNDESPFGFDFAGGSSFGGNGEFGIEAGFGSQSEFSGGAGFGGGSGFGATSGFGGGSDFVGSAFGGASAGFGSSGDHSPSFSSGFGGFNF